MKIVHIHREPRPGAFSIEILFRTIADELRNRKVNVIEFEMGPRSKLFTDVRALRRLNADVYHVTGDVNYLIFLLPRTKTVLTVHDIGHYRFCLTGWRRLLYRWLWLVGPIRLASRVTTVSVTTKNDIVNYLKFSAARLSVVENCHHPMYKPTRKVFNEECPRILQVGTKPYKNVPRLIGALRGIRCHLILIGELDGEIIDALQKNCVRYESLIGISQQELIQQYVAADLATFVSIGEGFGLPIIEAQAMGLPIITSNVPPMCEVAGPGACLADPLNVAAIRERILRLVLDEKYRDATIAAGLTNVLRYSPEVIGQAYLDLYKEVVGMR